MQITMSYKFILNLKYKIESETSTNITKLATIKQTNSTELKKKNKLLDSKSMERFSDKLSQIILAEKFEKSIYFDIRTHLNYQKIDKLSKTVTYGGNVICQRIDSKILIN